MKPAPISRPDHMLSVKRPLSRWPLMAASAMLALSSIALSTASSAAAEGEQLLYVAGTTVPPPTDRPVVELLSSAGFDVTVVDDDSVDAGTADGYDVVIISSSVVANKVGSAFRRADVGLVSTEAYVLDDLGMTNGGSSERGEGGGTTIEMGDTDHEIAGGRTGDVVVVNAGPLAFGRPGAAASVIATIAGTDDAALFAYETGASMVGMDAPARRVGLFMTYPSAGELTADGENLVVRAVQWATSSTPPAGSTTTTTSPTTTSPTITSATITSATTTAPDTATSMSDTASPNTPAPDTATSMPDTASPNTPTPDTATSMPDSATIAIPPSGTDPVSVAATSLTPAVTVTPGDGRLSFQWFHPDAGQYQLRTRPTGTSGWNWNPPTKETTAQLTGLALRSYDIEVRAYIPSSWRGWVKLTVDLGGGPTTTTITPPDDPSATTTPTTSPTTTIPTTTPTTTIPTTTIPTTTTPTTTIPTTTIPPDTDPPANGQRPFGHWADGSREFRAQIAVSGAGVDRTGTIATVAVDFAELLAEQGATAGFAASSLHLVRVDSQGRAIAEAVPVQFVAAAPGAANGELLVAVDGALGATEVAHFDLYFETTEQDPAPISFPAQVTVATGLDEGLDTLEVTTPAATYHFDTAGGGFSSLVDTDGNDWIGYSSAPRSTGEFRGIPNLIYPEGTFHPGALGVVTTLVEDGPLRTAFTAETADGAWAARWEITADVVRMRLDRAGHDYWFLYEGAPGGVFEPTNDIYVRPDGTTVPAGDTVPTDIAGDEWALVADRALGRGLFFSHSGDDTAADGHAPFEGAMVIAAFGRASPTAVPLMSAVPAEFTFGLVDTVTADGAADAVYASRIAPAATLGPSERRAPGERVEFTVLSRDSGDLPPPPDGSTTEQVALIHADLDGDNDDDIVVVGRNGANSLQWYRRDTSGKWAVSLIEPDDLPLEPNGTFGDVDGDGDLDLIVGASRVGNEIWWWENPDPHFTQDRWVRRAAISSGSVKHHDLGFGDVDGDGAPELVYWTQGPPRDPVNELWVADVPADPTQAGEWSTTLVHDSDVNREGLALVDIDDDGVLDILAGGSWFGFDGAAYVEEVIAPSTEVRVAAAQLVPGGRPEVVFSAGDVVGDLTFHEWTGAAWTTRSLLSGPAPFDGVWRHGHTLDIADVDLDGHLDVFSAEMVLPDAVDSAKQEARALIFYGDGTGSFTSELLTRGLDHHESAFADVDGDGDADLVRKSFNVGMPVPGLDVMINTTVAPNPRLAQWAKHVIDVKPARATFIHAADADGDGDEDLFAGAWWYENTGEIGSGWVRHTIGDPLGDVLLVDDLDGDGDVDVFGALGPVGSGPDTRRFAWAENDGTGLFSVHSNIDAGTGSFVQGAETVRFTPDGPLEIWLSWNERTNGIQRFVVPDDPTSTQWRLETVVETSQGEQIDFGDVDGDGDLDLFLGHYWVENDPGGAGWTPHQLHEPTLCCFAGVITTMGLPDRVVSADVDGDGDLDVVVSHEYDPSYRVAWYENPDGDPRGLWTEHVIGAGATALHSLDVADLDGDGDLDVVAGEHRLLDENIEEGRAWVFENLGGGERWIAHEIDGTDAHHDGTQLADLDNDGDLDVFSVGWLHDRVLVYENLGGTDTLPPDVDGVQVGQGRSDGFSSHALSEHLE